MVLLAYEIELEFYDLTHKKCQPKVGAIGWRILAITAQGCWYFKVYSKT